MIEILLGALLAGYVKARSDRDVDNIIEDFQNGKITREQALKKIAKANGDDEEFGGIDVPEDYKNLLEAGYTEVSLGNELKSRSDLTKKQKDRILSNLEEYKDYGNYDYVKAAKNRKPEASVTLQGDPEAIKRILGEK